VQIDHLANPRIEAEQHYYNPRHQKLIELGLEPRLLSDVLLDTMLKRIQQHASRIKKDIILPRVNWDGSTAMARGEKLSVAARPASD
jgi:UDP-sulfoquinovose synthase